MLLNVKFGIEVNISNSGIWEAGQKLKIPASLEDIGIHKGG